MTEESPPGKAEIRKLQHFETCAQAINQLFRNALEAQGSSAFFDFLERVQRLDNISIYNAMLVQVQRPGAVAVLSANDWKKKERSVLPDAIPIVILQPFGPVRFVYDYADTLGAPMQGEKDNPLLAQGVLHKATYDRIKGAAAKYRVLVEICDQYGLTLAGTASSPGAMPQPLAPTKEHPLWRIRLNARHDLPTRFATLAHELGHIYCGHVGADPKGRWPDRSKLETGIRELEAESVAWLVCQRNKVVPRSESYLQRYVRNCDVSEVSMYAIFEAANRVEARTSPKKAGA